MARTIAVGEFKAKCLRIIDQVNETGDPLVITKRGKPVAELRAVRPSSRSAFGFMKGQIRIKGDIISPLDLEWDALRDS